MSGILPLAIVNAFRIANNVAVSIYGIEATLYLATNDTAVEGLDDYQATQDYTYIPSFVKVWVEFQPNMYRLRKVGLFVKDDNMPILAHFSNDIEIPRYSYLEIPITFLPNNRKAFQQWEIVDQKLNQLADLDIKRTYAFTPRRVPIT